VNDQDHQHSENCFFCRLIRDKESRDKESYRIVEWEEDEDYFAILPEKPKISGHLLVVSKHPFNDITEMNADSDETLSLLKAVVYWSKILKKCLHAEKVYVMTMCDHWDPEELPKGQKETTEHLHFHLLPRYKTNRPERGEWFFTRKEENGFESRPFVLEKIKAYLTECKRRKRIKVGPT